MKLIVQTKYTKMSAYYKEKYKYTIQKHTIKKKTL